MPQWEQVVLLVSVVAVCVATDIALAKIYNFVVVPAALAGIGLNAFLSGWSGVWDSGLGLGLGFGLFAILFAMGAVGGGDVKLIAAIGAVCGWVFVLNVIVFSLVANGVMAAARLARRGKLGGTLRKAGRLVLGLFSGRLKGTAAASFRGGERSVFSIAAAIGCFGAFFWDVVGLVARTR